MMKLLKKWMQVLLALIVAVFALCGCSSEEGTASVQSVSMICGLGSLGIQERFAAIVSARSEVKVTPENGKTIGEVLVKEGDNITEGQVLFTYDMDLAELNLEKAQLELDQMKASLTAKEAEKEKLETEKAKAPESAQLSYTLEIQECETQIREANYNITLKERELALQEEALGVTEYVSPITGRVKSLNMDVLKGDYYGNDSSFMTLIETGTYRVKGYINENNVGAINIGEMVLVRSRTSDETWTGVISMIDWENASQGNNDVYYYDMVATEMSNSSKYPFYVELDDASGLMLGQHVYIEPYGEGMEVSLGLPSYYLFDMNDSMTKAYVWAENAQGKLEKREVALGMYNEWMDSYEITGGLGIKDYIAFPADDLKPGMKCEEFDEDAFNTQGDFVYEGDFEGDFDYGYEGEGFDMSYNYDEEIVEEEVME